MTQLITFGFEASPFFPIFIIIVVTFLFSFIKVNVCDNTFSTRFQWAAPCIIRFGSDLHVLEEMHVQQQKHPKKIPFTFFYMVKTIEWVNE